MIYYVDAKAGREGNGSRECPFRRINEAAKIAVAGDEVVVAEGIYREFVSPVHPGTEEKRIVYRSEKPLGAVITGAEPVTGWKKVRGTTWTVRVKNGVFGSYNPYTTRVGGDWYFSPAVRHTGAVFLNDLMMYEADSVADVKAGKPDPNAWNKDEAKYLWCSEQDGDETVFYANFHGKDPNAENVEISVRRNCFMPTENEIGYITVSGFKITKAATTWAPPAAYQDGMIGPHWSKGWIIEDCEISNSRCCGISLGKYLDPENDMYFTKNRVKSPTQMERDAVCRGQYHGWLKERIGSHIVRRCNIHHCEQTGIVGRMGGVFSVIEDCHIHHICTSQQLGGAETAGIKLHAGIDVTIRRNHIHDCIMGIWLDWEAQGARITQNLLHDNCRPAGTAQAPGTMFNTDIFIEVGHGPTLIDNNLLLSPVSITIPSEGIAVVHNLILGSFSLINSGVDSVVNGQREPRYTPYHIRHRTEVAGFMTILHGDDRIYNNIFIQQYPVTDPEKKPTDADYPVVGTKCFDIFPTYEEWYAPFSAEAENHRGLAEAHFGHLPVWVDGNAYFNHADVYAKEKNNLVNTRAKVSADAESHRGLAEAHFGHLPVWVDGNAYFNHADVYAKEKNNLINTRAKVSAELVQNKSGKITLKTNLYTYLKDFRDGLISTETLGKAFEPEQYFENPDGTPILFDTDFLGNHRGIDTIPGPFACEADSKKELWS